MSSVVADVPELTRAVVAQRARGPRLHLTFLDGLRGLSALYVVVYHILDLQLAKDGWPPVAKLLASPLMHGHQAVCVFIVLSGFCLMLPVVRAADGRMPGGWRAFFVRRARRILPPYYATLALALLLIVGWHLVKGASGDPKHAWSAYNSGFGNIVSHLLLIHNWVPAWAFNIDVPLWSVATEWHIYFLFPLVLLPIWRRWGSAAAVCAGLALGSLPRALYTPQQDLIFNSFWFLGLFAMGMAGAAIVYSPADRSKRHATPIPWGALAVAAFAAGCLATGLRGDHRGSLSAWFLLDVGVDTLFGLSAMCLIVSCAQRLSAASLRSRGWLLRLFEARAVVALGRCSYSLYLTHYLVVSALPVLLRRMHGPAALTLSANLVVGVGLSLVLAWVFYLAFERPFLSRPGTAVRNAVEVARPLADPAPAPGRS